MANDSSFFQLYRNLCASDGSDLPPSDKADCKRKLAVQANCANKGNSGDCANFYVEDQHLMSYCETVDEKDPDKGLNNYAAGALALSDTFKNDSKNWSLSGINSGTLFQNLHKITGLDIRKTENAVKSLKEVCLRAPELPIKTPPAFPRSFGNSRHDQQQLQRLGSPEVQLRFPSNGGVREPDNVLNRQLVRKPDVQQVPSLASEPGASKDNSFRTARDQLIIDKQKNSNGNPNPSAFYSSDGQSRTKSLGARRTFRSPFVPPVKDANANLNTEAADPKVTAKSEEIQDPRLKNIDPKMVELIENEIMDHGAPVTWDHIAGLEFAKATIKEIVVWPMLRPDIFTGLRGPPRGILLFGPPGTGKTLIGKCIASQSRSTFFSISASSLTSKWVGDGEKMVRALFAVARVHQPAVVFIDEIDSLLAQRSDTEHESSRRIKTEFLVQLDGATTTQEDRLLIVGATNRPQELDEAARRRLVKRLYIPLPELEARKQIINILMQSQRNDLAENDIDEICRRTDGYSGADMTNLCREAALGPIRAIPMEDIEFISPDQVRAICLEDFLAALHQVKASVSDEDLALYEDWNRRYGSVSK